MTKSSGLKMLTKPFSKPVQMAKGGKGLEPDPTKKRLYKVGAEKNQKN